MTKDRVLTYEQALEAQIEYVKEYPLDFNDPGLKEDVMLGIKIGMQLGLEVALETFRECKNG